MLNRWMNGLILLGLMAAAPVHGAVDAKSAQALYDRVTPSLVGVQYTWDSELGRSERIGVGTIVTKEGLVLASMALTDMRIPDAQMKDFKILVPRASGEPDEIDAVFVGRDERTNMAYIRAKEPQSWTPIQFEDVPLAVGQTVLSVGILPKGAGYRTYLRQATVAAQLRGEVPLVLVDGGLAIIGSPVFDEAGRAVGSVILQPEQQVFLNDPRNPLGSITDPAMFFVPSRDFMFGLSDLPEAGTPLKLPWIGVPQLTGLKKDEAEFFGLDGKPAAEVGDVIPGTPADKAGLQRGMVIVTMDGQPLETGDEVEEIPAILRRNIMRKQVGDVVTFGVLAKKGEPLKEIAVTLEERPKSASTAERFWAEDLGFAVRDLVFMDTYARKLPSDSKGVLVAWVKPQSSAQTAMLKGNDMVTELNSQPVTDVPQFKALYEQIRKDKPREAVVLVVLREGDTQVIRIEPPQ